MALRTEKRDRRGLYKANQGTSICPSPELKHIPGHCDWCEQLSDPLIRVGGAKICRKCKELEQFMLGG